MQASLRAGGSPVLLLTAFPRAALRTSAGSPSAGASALPPMVKHSDQLDQLTFTPWLSLDPPQPDFFQGSIGLLLQRSMAILA